MIKVASLCLVLMLEGVIHCLALSIASAADLEDVNITVTSGRIYYHNVVVAISLNESSTKQSSSPRPHFELCRLYQTRSTITGSPEDLTRALAHIDFCIVSHKESRYLTERARINLALHRYKHAEEDIACARRLGEGDAQLEELEQELAWQRGDHSLAEGLIRRRAAVHKDTHAFVRLAKLEADYGNYPAARIALEDAYAVFQGTDSLLAAWLDLQTGSILGDCGPLDKAIMRYRSALQHLPCYVAAQEHLAESLWETGELQAAHDLYSEIAHQTDDPEFWGRLAAVKRALNQDALASSMAQRARQRWEERLQAYPELSWRHAGEFYAQEGDQQAAVALLKKHVGNGSNGDALLSLARVQLEGGQLADARKSIQKLLKTPLRTQDVRTLLGHKGLEDLQRLGED